MRTYDARVLSIGLCGLIVTKNRPLFYFHQNKLIVNYQKRPLKGRKIEPRDERLRALSLAQLSAIDLVGKLAYEHALAISQQPGDMHFFNNLALPYAQSAYTDSAAPKIKHHLKPE